jgi:hypothetical protein
MANNSLRMSNARVAVDRKRDRILFRQRDLCDWLLVAARHLAVPWTVCNDDANDVTEVQLESRHGIAEILAWYDALKHADEPKSVAVTRTRDESVLVLGLTGSFRGHSITVRQAVHAYPLLCVLLDSSEYVWCDVDEYLLRQLAEPDAIRAGAS